MGCEDAGTWVGEVHEGVEDAGKGMRREGGSGEVQEDGGQA